MTQPFTTSDYAPSRNKSVRAPYATFLEHRARNLSGTDDDCQNWKVSVSLSATTVDYNRESTGVSDGVAAAWITTNGNTCCGLRLGSCLP